ncbi:MAG: hypothetical protein P4L86_11140, partial [Mycobacterium sp.]|nr:hypothetical protein [Mycobacterium sp.]
MSALAVSTVSAVPGQTSAAQAPAVVLLALPFATRLAGILDAALTSATGAAGPSSQPTAGDTQAGTTTATSHGADSAPVAGWAWGVPADTQDEPIRSTRPRVSQGPHHPQRPATSQDAAPAGAVASAVAGKVETSSSALTIKLAETKPGG